MTKSPLLYAMAFAGVYCFEFISGMRFVDDISGGSRAGLGGAKLNYISGVYRLSGGILLGMGVIQAERIFAAMFMTAADYGKYMIVASVSMIGFQLQIPINKAFIPVISREGVGSFGEKGRSYRLYWSLSIALAFALLLCLGLATYPLLNLWLQNPTLVEELVPAVRWAYVGVFMNCVFAPMYANIIIRNKGRLLLFINGIALSLIVTLLLSLNSRMGIEIGGQCLVIYGLVQWVGGALSFKR